MAYFQQKRFNTKKKVISHVFRLSALWLLCGQFWHEGGLVKVLPLKKATAPHPPTYPGLLPGSGPQPGVTVSLCLRG